MDKLSRKAVSEHVNTETEKTVVWVGGGWAVGTETDQPVLLLYHLGRESWHSIRRHPAILAQHCSLRAQHPPLCTPPLGWPSLARPGSPRLQIAHPQSLRVPTGVHMYGEHKWLISGATCESTCTYTLLLISIRKNPRKQRQVGFLSSFLQFQCLIKLQQTYLYCTICDRKHKKKPATNTLF